VAPGRASCYDAAVKIASVEAFDINPLQLNGPQLIETTFLHERVWKGGGRVTVPEGPGLGVLVDETYVRRHAVAVPMP
jgi:L-alanine-DL-glutamate epimerase-like enolase superfamily enzyme